MSNLYRIIEHRFDDGVPFYTIQIQHRWIFGLKFWSTLKSYSSDGSCSTPKIFDGLEDARKFIRRSRHNSTVIEEGVL